MDLASGKIELSERYIQKLKCGHTLQSYNAVVLWRNNGIGTPSVTAANMLGSKTSIKYILWTLTSQLSNFNKNFNRKLKDTE